MVVWHQKPQNSMNKLPHYSNRHSTCTRCVNGGYIYSLKGWACKGNMSILWMSWNYTDLCLSWEWAGITLNCTHSPPPPPPSPLKIYTQRNSPKNVAQCVCVGQPPMLLQVVGLLIFYASKSTSATILLQEQGGSHLYSFLPNFAW